VHKQKRLHRILELLKTDGFCTTKDLAEQLGVSQTTIYRDLHDLSGSERVKKSYGGVALMPSEGLISHLDFDLRRTLHLREKEAIAEMAAELVADGDSLFVDASTTCLLFGQALLKKGRRRLTVITCSPRLVLLLQSEPDCQVICTGGTYLKHFDSLVGMPGE